MFKTKKVGRVTFKYTKLYQGRSKRSSSSLELLSYNIAARV